METHFMCFCFLHLSNIISFFTIISNLKKIILFSVWHVTTQVGFKKQVALQDVQSLWIADSYKNNPIIEQL